MRHAGFGPGIGRWGRTVSCVRPGCRTLHGLALVGTIASAAVIGSAPVQAQDSAAIIERRIEAVFKIVPRNTLDLALPLSRRALARRAEDEVVPLAYRATSTPAIDPEPQRIAAEAPVAIAPEVIASPETEEGSAEGADDEVETARLPRPRPVRTEDAAAPEDAAAVPADPDDLVARPAPEAADPAGPAILAAEPPTQVAPPEIVVAAVAPVAPPASQAAEPPNAAPSAVAQEPTELVAREDCLNLDDVADPDDDFSRNAEALKAPGICITQRKFRERRRPWTIQTVESGRAGPLWVVMHDDEGLAFDNAVEALGTYGGTFVTVDTRGKRNQDGIDPNRNFSDETISCSKLGKSASPKFTGAFKALLEEHRPIIALHNNHDGPVPTGGIGHVSMKTVPKDMKSHRSDDGALASDRALVLLAASEIGGPGVQARIDELSAKGVNVVVESVKEGRGDCSLSNYAVLSGHGDYFNVTVDHDEGEKQRGIIAAIVATFATVSAAR